MKTALVVGVTGMAGYNTAAALVEAGWSVIGLSRRHRYDVPGVTQVHADVNDAEAVAAAVTGRGVTHVFFTTWSRQATEAENCRVNSAMLRSALQGAGRAGRLEHVVLVTGLKIRWSPLPIASVMSCSLFSGHQRRASTGTPALSDQVARPFAGFAVIEGLEQRGERLGRGGMRRERGLRRSGASGRRRDP